LAFESLAGGSAGIPVFDCFSLSDFLLCQSLLQAAVVSQLRRFLGAGLPDAAGFGAIALIVLLLALGVTALSLGLAFACLVTLN